MSAVATTADRGGMAAWFKRSLARYTIQYLLLVREILGPDWMTRDRFRFGDSRVGWGRRSWSGTRESNVATLSRTSSSAT